MIVYFTWDIWFWSPYGKSLILIDTPDIFFRGVVEPLAAQLTKDTKKVSLKSKFSRNFCREINFNNMRRKILPWKRFLEVQLFCGPFSPNEKFKKLSQQVLLSFFCCVHNTKIKDSFGTLRNLYLLRQFFPFLTLAKLSTTELRRNWKWPFCFSFGSTPEKDMFLRV